MELRYLKFKDGEWIRRIGLLSKEIITLEEFSVYRLNLLASQEIIENEIFEQQLNKEGGRE